MPRGMLIAMLCVAFLTGTGLADPSNGEAERQLRGALETVFLQSWGQIQHTAHSALSAVTFQAKDSKRCTDPSTPVSEPEGSKWPEGNPKLWKQAQHIFPDSAQKSMEDKGLAGYQETCTEDPTKCKSTPAEKNEKTQCLTCENKPCKKHTDCALGHCENEVCLLKGYLFSKSFGDYKVGTNGISLDAMDGDITYAIKEGKLSLKIRSNRPTEDWKDAGTPQQREQRTNGICQPQNMMTLKLKLHDFGLTMPGFDDIIWAGVKSLITGDQDEQGNQSLLKKISLKGVGATAAKFVRDALYLDGLIVDGVMRIENSYLMHVDSGYELQIGLAMYLEATPTTDGGWEVTHESFCSTGLEFGSNMREKVIAKVPGLSRQFTFGDLEDKLKDKLLGLGQKIKDPLYCAIKYQLPEVAWLGHISAFVAKDSKPIVQSIGGNELDGGNEQSCFEISLKKKLTSGQNTEGGSLLLETGFEFNVPTKKFVEHILTTAQGISAANDKELEAEKDGIAAKTKTAKAAVLKNNGDKTQGEINDSKEKRKLAQLAAMGFDPEVLKSLNVIKQYFAKLTESTARASSTISGIVENLYNLIFSKGNAVKAVLQGGVHIGRDSESNFGGISFQLAKLFVQAIAKETPIDLAIFMKSAADITATAKENPASLLTANTDLPDCFILSGEVTVVDITNLEAMASMKSAKDRQSKINAVLDNAMVEKIFGMFLDAVLKDDIRIDLTTENDICSAASKQKCIQQWYLGDKRIKLGGKIGYNGPFILTAVMKSLQSAVNTAARVSVNRRALADSVWGKCMKTALDKYDQGTTKAAKTAAINEKVCHCKTLKEPARSKCMCKTLAEPARSECMLKI